MQNTFRRPCWMSSFLNIASRSGTGMGSVLSRRHVDLLGHFRRERRKDGPTELARSSTVACEGLNRSQQERSLVALQLQRQEKSKRTAIPRKPQQGTLTSY